VTTTDPFTPCWEPVCGNPGCGGWRVDDNVVSLGTGVSDLNGRRSDPCWVCAQAWKAQHPTDETYPSGPVETRDPHRYVINRIGYGAHHRLPHLEVRDPSPRQHDFLVGFILASHCDDPRVKVRSGFSSSSGMEKKRTWQLLRPGSTLTTLWRRWNYAGKSQR
jgi:hypothetical protein